MTDWFCKISSVWVLFLVGFFWTSIFLSSRTADIIQGWAVSHELIILLTNQQTLASILPFCVGAIHQIGYPRLLLIDTREEIQSLSGIKLLYFWKEHLNCVSAILEVWQTFSITMYNHYCCEEPNKYENPFSNEVSLKSRLTNLLENLVQNSNKQDKLGRIFNEYSFLMDKYMYISHSRSVWHTFLCSLLQRTCLSSRWE